MLSGKDLILATKPYAKEIRIKSWYHALIAFFLLAFAETGTLYFHNMWVKAGCSISAGLLIIRMFVIYHDHQHHAILYGSKLGNLIMTIFGIYMLAPTSIWKRSHDHHHKHNSKLFSASIGSYPIVTKNKFLQMSEGERRSYLASRHPLTILFGYFSMFVFGMCVASFRSNPKKHFDSLLALIIHLTASVLLFYFLGWQAWVLTIVIPFSIACGVGAYLFYVQHNFPGVYFSENKEWKYENAALQSSSFLVMSPFMNWISANIGYHHIHHLNSRIPFYRLPEAMAAIPALQQAKRTSFAFRDIAASLKLKVWDEEQEQMVTLKNMGLKK